MQSRRLANHIAKRVLSTAAPQEPALTRVSPQSSHNLHFLLLFNRLKIPYDQLNDLYQIWIVGALLGVVGKKSTGGEIF